MQSGEPDSATEYFARAMRLSPLDPELYRMQAGMAAAHLWHLPSFLMVVAVMAMSHALAGQTDEAERSIRHLRQLDPTLRVRGR